MNSGICLLCNSQDENIYELGEKLTFEGLSMHYFCLYLSSGLVQNGDENEDLMGFLLRDIKKESNRVRQLKCYYCKKSHANIGCCNRKCRRTFHTGCAMKNNCVSEMANSFKSFCHEHAPNRNGKRKHTKMEQCGICFDSMGQYKRATSILAKCCNKWFHKLCLIKAAQSAGYFFKCPLCNCSDEFRQDVVLKGIFIPDQDASWEREENAFSELLERNTTCVANECKCPKGRNFQNDEYDVTFCNMCGSVCVHDICWSDDSQFCCEECVKVELKNVNTGESIRNNDTDKPSSSSDQMEDRLVGNLTQTINHIEEELQLSDEETIDIEHDDDVEHTDNENIDASSSDDECINLTSIKRRRYISSSEDSSRYSLDESIRSISNSKLSSNESNESMNNNIRPTKRFHVVSDSDSDSDAEIKQNIGITVDENVPINDNVIEESEPYVKQSSLIRPDRDRNKIAKTSRKNAISDEDSELSTDSDISMDLNQRNKERITEMSPMTLSEEYININKYKDKLNNTKNSSIVNNIANVLVRDVPRKRLLSTSDSELSSNSRIDIKSLGRQAVMASLTLATVEKLKNNYGEIERHNSIVNLVEMSSTESGDGSDNIKLSTYLENRRKLKGQTSELINENDKCKIGSCDNMVGRLSISESKQTKQLNKKTQKKRRNRQHKYRRLITSSSDSSETESGNSKNFVAIEDEGEVSDISAVGKVKKTISSSRVCMRNEVGRNTNENLSYKFLKSSKNETTRLTRSKVIQNQRAKSIENLTIINSESSSDEDLPLISQKSNQIKIAKKRKQISSDSNWSSDNVSGNERKKRCTLTRNFAKKLRKSGKITDYMNSSSDGSPINGDNKLNVGKMIDSEERTQSKARDNENIQIKAKSNGKSSRKHFTSKQGSRNILQQNNQHLMQMNITSFFK